MFQVVGAQKELATRQTCLYFASVTDTKQRILDTAAELFCERGYEMVGINELIEKSGVAKATFYQHFRSKEKLCVEWLKQEAAESEQAARALLDSEKPPLEKVAEKFDRVRHYLQSSEFRGCPFSNTATAMTDDNEARQVVTDYKAGARLFWQALALQLRRDPSAARALGDALFLLFSGAITESQNSKAMWPVESAKTAALILCSAT